MRWVSTAAQVRELDRRAIEDVGVPGVALMELAADGVARSIRAHHAQEAAAGVAVVCGAGNNGGDGYAIARRLRAWGFAVHTVSIRRESDGDAAQMRRTCAALGIDDRDHLGECGLIVDAVFGNGLTRSVGEPIRGQLAALNAHSAPVIAVDLPSGVHADTGQVLGVAVQAVRTVSFARLKPGLLLSPGRELAGAVEVVDIGLDVGVREDPLAVAEIPDREDLVPHWPHRKLNAHKADSGHLLVIAGSTAMAGAAVLCCRAALKAGAGLVTLVTAGGALPRLVGLPPEVMVVPVGTGGRISQQPEGELSRYSAFLAGPGLGGGHALAPDLASWLSHLWALDDRPMVFDADALVCAGGGGGGPRVVTPHPGEAARMLGSSTAEVQRDRLTAAQALAVGGRVALLKGPGTLIASAQRLSMNPTGGPVLATAGSGDVLAGVIGALLARGASARDAARLGAWVHGAAADLLAAHRSEGWVASDVIDALPDAIAALTAEAP